MNALKLSLVALSTSVFALGCGGTQHHHSSTAHAAQLASEAPAEARADIVDTAIDAGTFKTLVAAVQAADLVDALKGDGPFTVFAPTDEAFAKLPEGTVEALLADKDKLIAVLTYHVVPGRVMASDVVNIASATTLQGGALSVSASDGVRINDARVLAADVEASNGVIHVIDTVLIPE